MLEAGAPLALANLQAATEVVDAGVCVDVVVDGVGVAFAVPLRRGGGGGGGLDRGHRLPHSHVCPISKGLDGVTYGKGTWWKHQWGGETPKEKLGCDLYIFSIYSILKTEELLFLLTEHKLAYTEGCFEFISK